MPYEHKKHPLLSRRRFARRLLRHVVISVVAVVLSLGIGMWGYMHYEHLGWRDAFLNSAMLLGGMGPVDMPRTDHGKLFAGLFALFSGFFVLIVAGIVMAPVVHRLMHHFHLVDEESSRS